MIAVALVNSQVLYDNLTALQAFGFIPIIYGILLFSQSIQKKQFPKSILGVAIFVLGVVLVGLKYGLQAMGVIA